MLSLLLLLACTPDLVDTGDGRPELECAEGEVADGERCVPEACGVGTWGHLDTTGAVLVEGSGLAEALASAEEGATLLLAEGTYQGPLSIEAPITIRGRCLELVVVDGGDEEEVAISIRAGASDELLLQDLTLTGGTEAVVEHTRGKLSLRRVDVVDALGVGLYGEGGMVRITAEDLRFSGSRPSVSQRMGRSVDMELGARLEVEGLVIEDGSEAGLVAMSGGDLVVRGGEIRDIGPDARGYNGSGLVAWDPGTTVVLEDVSIERALGVGVDLALGAEAELNRVQVHDTQLLKSQYGVGLWVSDSEATATELVVTGGYGAGVFVQSDALVELSQVSVSGVQVSASQGAGIGVDGASLVLEGGTLEDNVLFGLNAGKGSVVQVRATTIQGTLADEGVGYGVGVGVLDEAQVYLEEVEVLSNHGGGVSVSEATLEATDCALSDNLPTSDGTVGHGLQATEGAQVALVRPEVAGNTEVGLLADGEGTRVLVQGGVIRDTAVDTLGMDGYGAYAQKDAWLRLEGVEVRDNHTAAVASALGGEVEVVEGSVLSGTRPNQVWQMLGRGAEVGQGGRLLLEDSAIEEVLECGVLAHAEGSEARLVRSTITGVGRGAHQSAALGVAAQEGAVLVLEEVEISRISGPGLRVWDAEVQATGCTLEEVGFAGAVIQGGSLELVDTTVRGVREDPSEGGGMGVYADANADVDLPTTLVLQGVEVEGAPVAGVRIRGQGSWQVLDSTLTGATGSPMGPTALAEGDGICASDGATAWTGSQGLLVSGCTLTGNLGAAVLLHDAAATVEESVISDNGDEVVQQACGLAGDVEVDDVEVQVEYCPARDRLLVPVSFDVYLLEAGLLE